MNKFAGVISIYTCGDIQIEVWNNKLLLLEEYKLLKKYGYTS